MKKIVICCVLMSAISNVDAEASHGNLWNVEPVLNVEVGAVMESTKGDLYRHIPLPEKAPLRFGQEEYFPSASPAEEDRGRWADDVHFYNSWDGSGFWCYWYEGVGSAKVTLHVASYKDRQWSRYEGRVIYNSSGEEYERRMVIVDPIAEMSIGGGLTMSETVQYLEKHLHGAGAIIQNEIRVEEDCFRAEGVLGPTPGLFGVYQSFVTNGEDELSSHYGYIAKYSQEQEILKSPTWSGPDSEFIDFFATGAHISDQKVKKIVVMTLLRSPLAHDYWPQHFFYRSMWLKSDSVIALGKGPDDIVFQDLLKSIIQVNEAEEGKGWRSGPVAVPSVDSNFPMMGEVPGVVYNVPKKGLPVQGFSNGRPKMGEYAVAQYTRWRMPPRRRASFHQRIMDVGLRTSGTEEQAMPTYQYNNAETVENEADRKRFRKDWYNNHRRSGSDFYAPTISNDGQFIWLDGAFYRADGKDSGEITNSDEAYYNVLHARPKRLPGASKDYVELYYRDTETGNRNANLTKNHLMACSDTMESNRIVCFSDMEDKGEEWKESSDRRFLRYVPDAARRGIPSKAAIASTGEWCAGYTSPEPFNAMAFTDISAKPSNGINYLSLARTFCLNGPVLWLRLWRDGNWTYESFQKRMIFNWEWHIDEERMAHDHYGREVLIQSGIGRTFRFENENTAFTQTDTPEFVSHNETTLEMELHYKDGTEASGEDAATSDRYELVFNKSSPNVTMYVFERMEDCLFRFRLARIEYPNMVSVELSYDNEQDFQKNLLPVKIEEKHNGQVMGKLLLELSSCSRNGQFIEAAKLESAAGDILDKVTYTSNRFSPDILDRLVVKRNDGRIFYYEENIDSHEIKFDGTTIRINHELGKDNTRNDWPSAYNYIDMVTEVEYRRGTGGKPYIEKYTYSRGAEDGSTLKTTITKELGGEVDSVVYEVHPVWNEADQAFNHHNDGQYVVKIDGYDGTVTRKKTK